MKFLPMLSVAFIFGCASVGDYWTHIDEPLEVKFVVRNDFPCGQKWDACWNPAGRTIELRKGMSASLEDCRLRHEYAHAKGWRHPLNMELAVDCGPEKI